MKLSGALFVLPGYWRGKGKPEPASYEKSYLQASVRQFFFQRAQVAVLLTQRYQIARPYFMLTKFFVQRTHLRKLLASCLIILTTTLSDQSFSLPPIQFNGLMRSRLFG